jgi:hypothetical protein
MLDKFKKALQLARTNVWALLLTLFPFADQIIAFAEAQLPALAPYLGANVFRYMGVSIVAAKFALQLWRGWAEFKAMLGRMTIGG